MPLVSSTWWKVYSLLLIQQRYRIGIWHQQIYKAQASVLGLRKLDRCIPTLNQDKFRDAGYIGPDKVSARYWEMYILGCMWLSVKLLLIKRTNNMKPNCVHWLDKHSTVSGKRREMNMVLLAWSIFYSFRGRQHNCNLPKILWVGVYCISILFHLISSNWVDFYSSLSRFLPHAAAPSCCWHTVYSLVLLCQTEFQISKGIVHLIWILNHPYFLITS